MNLIFGWIWILMGIFSGMIIGMKFHHENWMGGYASHRRRLVRLGHISFIGLGILNILFALSIHQELPFYHAASLLFIVGAVTMPVSCFLLAWNKRTHLVFSIPVLSLMAGIGLTLMGMIS